MVGDNPKSDVAGANSMGRPWQSVLVRTGVFQGENDREHPADVVVDDVAEAVSFALKCS
jgi:ribonucleotide monophosphatase NagD (HAD superfamily)